jgi:hypothetical protein
MEFSNLPAPQPPTITLDGNPLPAPGSGPSQPAGFQVVVLDPTQDITQPAAIVSNEYQPMIVEDDNWGSWYQFMYANLVTQLLMSGNVQQQLVLVASFGIDQNAPPTNDACEAFLELGANGQLQGWINGAVDRGSQSGDYLCASPVNYILVGTAATSYGAGNEVYEGTTENEVTTSLSVTVGNVGPPPT